ncbi:acyltransferase family protein [Pleionea mediterranea]|uniref:Peptidoglycan/LPS O-acetylase OafA/YrhL n=1 Tax=Pleionea mediterranea TaxID=523701 RepID=A0A316FY67_9GAMM|nr:acyltransferase [Pleionea mediterranea]PWK53704.1 peptidoglycan/LPS O-acetylase OafA/YrhL [Pleionea mediterranea]
MVKNKVFLPQLAWLRAFAALAVVVYHIRRALAPSYTGTDAVVDPGWLQAIDFGDFGVLLFFVLSGATLYLNHQDFDTKNRLSHFFTKRFFRVWPAFACSLIIYLIFNSFFASWYTIAPQGYWVEAHIDTAYTLSDLFHYLTFTFNITGPYGKFNAVYWSLPIEFQYYLIFPLLILSLRYLNLAGPILLAAVIYAMLHTPVRDYIDNAWTLMLAYTFCAGVWLGYLYKHVLPSFRLLPITGFILSAVVLVVLSVLNQTYDSFPSWIQSLPIIGIKTNMFGLFACLLVAVVLFTNFQTLKANRLTSSLEFLGEISYSIYLYHSLFICLSVVVLLQLGIIDYWLKLISFFAITLSGTLLVSWISYLSVERPSIKLAKKITRKQTV